MFTEVTIPEFDRLKLEIEAHPRLCGQYIIGLVSIRNLRNVTAPQETLLEKVIQHFDGDRAEKDPDFVPDHEWTDYETDRDEARLHTIEAMTGGGQIGHTRETMSPSKAAEFFDRFVALCGSNPRFYIRLGLGDREFVFSHGFLVVTDGFAGILWIVESD